MNDGDNGTEDASDSDEITDTPTEYRKGSPFRGDPFDEPLEDLVEADASAVTKVPEILDVGVMRSTASGAAIASLIILVFAAASAWTFPSGGIAVSALGCLMAVVGMTSPMSKTSIGCLLLHVSLFAVCFVKTGSGSG